MGTEFYTTEYQQRADDWDLSYWRKGQQSQRIKDKGFPVIFNEVGASAPQGKQSKSLKLGCHI